MTITLDDGREIRSDSAWVAPRPACRFYKDQPHGLRVWPPGCEAFTVFLPDNPTDEDRRAAHAEAKSRLRSLFSRKATTS